ncbi:MAG TPA: hypothetical protein VK991_10215 [Halomonas sp.]|nr:hypothetical protein [Halomonas sp.]
MTIRKAFTIFAAGLILLFSAAVLAQTDDDAAKTSNWFGGPTYDGEPALEVTAALVEAGGGADSFSFSDALVSMLGQETVDGEIAKLTEQYDEDSVGDFVEGMTLAVNVGLKRATEAGVELPSAPADLTGTKLAETLVTAGTTDDGTWWAGYLFDKALSHGIHNQVMADIEAEHGRAYDENIHRLLNQAMYDVAQALGHDEVKLAPLH